MFRFEMTDCGVEINTARFERPSYQPLIKGTKLETTIGLGILHVPFDSNEVDLIKLFETKQIPMNDTNIDFAKWFAEDNEFFKKFIASEAGLMTLDGTKFTPDVFDAQFSLYEKDKSDTMWDLYCENVDKAERECHIHLFKKGNDIYDIPSFGEMSLSHMYKPRETKLSRETLEKNLEILKNAICVEMRKSYPQYNLTTIRKLLCPM
jgi:hypothetical protein